MTTQYAVLPARSGRSYTAKLFSVSDLTTEITVTSITVTELAAKGLFRAAIVKPAVVAAGDYVLIYLYGSVAAAVGYFTFAGTDTETATETPPTAVLDPAARVKLDATQPDYAPSTAAALAAVDAKIGTPETSLSAMVGNVPTVAEFEARTIAAANYRQNITIRGTSMTEAQAFDLLLASLAGVTSQPSGTTEKFKFLDGNDAFTTTFDTNGNRTGVSLA